MMEVELKFQVPPQRRAAVLRAMSVAGAKSLRLRATYFDTAGRDLARAGIALRVRRHGRRWVQTLKGAGDGLWQRLEHEVAIDVPSGVVPMADPARHDGTPAGDALRRALGERPLAATHTTDVQRRVCELRGPGCVAEVAFDTGALNAAGRRWALCELEFELKQGEPQGLAELASRWVQRHGLTLDVRTKAERGDRLARGVRVDAPVRAEALKLPRDAAADAALRAIAANCLRQILANASEIAHEEATPEHLHQLRVGIRRLRSALRDLGDLSPAVRTGWAPALAALFGALGAARDLDALAASLLPALRKAGARTLQFPPPAAAPAPAAVLREPATTALWLELLAFAAAPPTPGEAFAPLAASRLDRLRRQVRRDAARFESLDDVRRHRLRKRVKRLRYLCEFVASLHDKRRVAAYLKAVAPAQDALGHFNDVCVARALLEPAAGADPQATFALGWLAHEHDAAVERCRAPLERLRKAEPFW